MKSHSHTASTGREALAAWLSRRATLPDRTVVLEEALLSGRFARYALRRLLAFGLVRSVGVVVHVVELVWLFEIFSAKPFVASIALQNVTLVVDALFWGALESLRARLRRLGATSEASALVSRWLTIAAWVGLGAIALPIAFFVLGKREDLLLHVYALACGIRLAADVVLRTYYSGVFAYTRVHRPVWSILSAPFVVIGVTIAGWNVLGGFSFVVALLASIAFSRGLLFVFTRRAYARFRLQRPHFRLWPRGLGTLFDRHVVLAAIANLSTRLGGVVLLAALIPSLTIESEFDDVPVIEPFAFGLHLAAPFLLAASQWAFVFYHDWKRLEQDQSSRLAALLGRRLNVCAVIVGSVCSLLASCLVLAFVPWARSWPTLVSLVLAAVGMSVWTAHQLRHFAHGEHLRQAISAGAVLIVVGIALSTADDLGVVAFYFALAFGPWAAIGLALVLERLLVRKRSGLLTSTAAFVDAAARARGDVVVWFAHVERRPLAIAERIAARLGDDGAVFREKNRLVWFERAHAKALARTEWLAMGGGRLRSLASFAIASQDAKAELLRKGIVGAPDEADGGSLERRHHELFPDGFVVRLDAPPPARFLALPASTRQAIWRDALRSRSGARGRSGWFVSCRSRNGVPEVVFAAPRPVSPEDAAHWRKAIAEADWRLASESR